MRYDFDAIIVGARCAGASTALLLARQGHKVLLLDRARFPSEIPQGHFIHRDGPRRLHAWGVLKDITATGCPPITTMTADFGDFPLVSTDLEIDNVAWGYGPRRSLLDKILIDAAVASGAELRDGFAVDDILFDGERVIGVGGRSIGGPATTITAPITIGADGRRSHLASVVHAPVYEAVPTLACWYFSYWSGVKANRLEMHVLPQRRAVFAFPTNADQLAIFVGWPIDEFAAVRSDVEGNVREVLDLTGDLGERVRDGKRVERFFGTGDVPNFLRQPCGPGWALVGDAGCHKDPFLALGIADALRDAELLAYAAHAGLSGERPLDAALDDYHRRRDQAVLPSYYENLNAARFGPMPAEVLQLRQALRDNPGDTTRFTMATQGMIPYADFFNPANLERITRQSMSGVPSRR